MRATTILRVLDRNISMNMAGRLRARDASIVGSSSVTVTTMASGEGEIASKGNLKSKSDVDTISYAHSTAKLIISSYISMRAGNTFLSMYAEWNLTKDTETNQFGNIRFRRLGGLEYSVASCIVGLVGFLSVGRYKWVLEPLDCSVKELEGEMGAEGKSNDNGEGDAL